MEKVMTVSAFYTNDPPQSYESSSLMSPDRRAFYLKDKNGTREVHQIPSNMAAAVTVDARFPIDLCCTHIINEKKMHVFFSSKMINVAKIAGEDEHLGVIAGLANEHINSKSHVANSSIMKSLPRRKGMRSQPGYSAIPLSSTGQIQVDPSSYPVIGDTPEPAYGLSTKDWYVWLSIILETSGGVRTTIMQIPDDKTYFVLRNAYHIVVQEL